MSVTRPRTFDRSIPSDAAMALRGPKTFCELTHVVRLPSLSGTASVFDVSRGTAASRWL